MICGNSSSYNGLRFNRKAQNANERLLFTSYWKELCDLYGTFGDYFVYDYALSAQDFFYGEEPMAPYRVPPVGFPIFAEFQNDSLLLSKFGIQAEAEVTFIIPIQSFYEKFGNGAEPKAGDVIRLTELGYDRPGSVQDLNSVAYAPLTACKDVTNPLDQICADGSIKFTAPTCSTDTNAYSAYNDPATFAKLLRGAPCYEITERRDENLTLNFNPLQGHYVWICHGKRFDYSYQPNAPREPGSTIPSDNTQSGLISSTIGDTGFPPACALPMPEDVRSPSWGNSEQETKKIWDNTAPNHGNETSTYGY